MSCGFDYLTESRSASGRRISAAEQGLDGFEAGAGEEDRLKILCFRFCQSRGQGAGVFDLNPHFMGIWSLSTGWMSLV